jgi:hypothetical protein
MIVVKLMGGHSNQLFQYALGRSLSHRLGAKLYMDVDWFDNAPQGDTRRFYELAGYNIQQNFISAKRLALVEKSDANLKTRVYKITKGLIKPRLLHYREKSHAFDQAVLNLPDNVYLEGFWQNEKYFKDIRPILLKEIELVTPLKSKARGYLRQIKDTESLSLHVRRGDYITNPEAKRFHGLTPMEYYTAAVDLLQKRLPEEPLRIFVFSNDLDWCKQNLKFKLPTTFVEGNQTGAEDMRLMKHCKHNILANSSFSWWGAWLNQNTDKIVIAPKVWFLDKEAGGVTEIIPLEWIRL